ncbi:MAG: hypothetical protein E6Q73_00880 [Pseudorhodobacter sp.]|nr:MAG: hypothetical protein E6Q73_00880 [Pseudorhodobacter sp.]
MALTKDERKARKARRAKTPAAPAHGEAKPLAAEPGTEPDGEALAALHLDDIDGWDLRQKGEWLTFTANMPGYDRPRQFRRLIAPLEAKEISHVIADAPGPLLGILTLGGARSAKTLRLPPAFPCHILTSADGIGPAGLSGTAEATALSHLHRVHAMTQETLLAEAYLQARAAETKSLPLIFVRNESDGSADIAELAEGMAFRNLMIAARNLRDAAARLGKEARLLCVRLNYGLEDVRSDETAFRAGMVRLLDKLTAGLLALGFDRPVFLANFDCGIADQSDHPAMRTYGTLAWSHGLHDFILPQPAYGLAHDSYGRLTPDAMRQLAGIELAALTQVRPQNWWFCPMGLLAEASDATIRVRFRAMGDLEIDAADPFQAGEAAGFTLDNAQGVEIAGVSLSPDDPQDVLIRLNRAPKPGLRLRYGIGAAPAPGQTTPPARGALREKMVLRLADGAPYFRWALPFVLDVH